jgi:hypothetical protein
VVTYDPRAALRNSQGTDAIPRAARGRPARVIDALGVGPVDCMGTSGGA